MRKNAFQKENEKNNFRNNDVLKKLVDFQIDFFLGNECILS